MLVENISDLLIFVQVVKTGNLSSAGRDLGFSAAVVSKRLQRLEEQLSVRLFNRTTRKVVLTDEGTRYYEYCVRILSDLEEAESLITCGNRHPKGTLRVTVPAAFGRLHIAPLVPIFLRRYPDLHLVLHLSDRVIDIIEEGYDIAVRIGDLKDSGLVARNLCIDNRVVVATPSYIEKHGEPQHPDDLQDYNALVFSSQPTTLNLWKFSDEAGQTYVAKVSGNFVTNNCDALREAILADLGIALRPTWDVWRDIESGIMQVLLPDYYPFAKNIHAVFADRRHMSQKVRVFIDLLAETFGDTPYWELSCRKN